MRSGSCWISVLLIIAGLVGVGAVGAAAQNAMSIEEVMNLFSSADDVMISFDADGQAQLEQAIDVIRDELGVPDYLDETNEAQVGAFAVAPEGKDLVNKLSQAYYTLADVFLRTLPSQEETFLMGKQWGFKSLRMNASFVVFEQQDGFIAAVEAETDIVALQWASANWLRVAEFDIMAAVTGRIPPKAKAMVERMLELDDSYMCYGAYRSLGAFWQGLPSDPISPILIGGLRQDYDQVLANLCRVVDEPTFCTACEGLIDPACLEYFENRTFFAEYYLIPLEQWEDAARVLRSVLDDPIGETYPLMNALCQEIAAGLLVEVELRL
ncbi:hypothetical protein JW848_06250 [Candidatus Bipolaricaulota bacterium]|nr:hypothetical protein [Candidatus Bipolaricaulota bacterium]